MPAQPWDYIAKLVCIGDSGTGKSSLTVRLCEGRFTPQHDVTIGVEFGSRIVPVGPPASRSLGINDPNAAAATQSKSPALPRSHSSPSSPRAGGAGGGSSGGGRNVNSSNSNQQKHMKLSLWDTAGQETYKSITRSYFRGASGALLVFDITRRATFEAVTQWLRDLRYIAEEGIVVILVGNKSDLAHSSMADGGSSAARPNRREVQRDEAETWCADNGVMRYVETSAKSGEGVERAFLEVAERIFQNIEAGKYDLNDRRSGVKGPGAGAANRSRSAAAGGTAGGGGDSVVLGMNNGGMDVDRKGWGGCCQG